MRTVTYRYTVTVDGTPMCSGPFDNTDVADADYLRTQMDNYRKINPRSDVRATITFADA